MTIDIEKCRRCKYWNGTACTITMCVKIAVEIPKIYYMIDNPYNHSFEVIGNIYENPELLKEGSV